MRGVLAGALIGLVLVTAGCAGLGGFSSSGPASIAQAAVRVTGNGRPTITIVKTAPAAGPTSDDGPTITIVKGTPTVGSSTNPNALPGAGAVAKLFKGIPQNGLVLGRSRAPVTLIEYVDLQCPICKAFETRDLAPLVKKYVRPGKLKIEMQPWNIIDANDGGDDSLRGQEATIGAARQNKAFNFAEVLYDNQGSEGSGWLNDTMVSNIAASVDRLKPYTLATDANSGATQKVIKSISHWAKTHSSQMVGTPTLYLTKGRGRPKYYGTGLPSLKKLETAIDALLK